MANDVQYPYMVVAVYDYEAPREDLLSFSQGDVLKITEAHGEGWLVGETDAGLSGLVATQFVEVVADDVEPMTLEDWLALPTIRRVVAIYEYSPPEDRTDLLGFDDGVVLDVIDEETPEHWIRCRLHDAVGLVPTQYVVDEGEEGEWFEDGDEGDQGSDGAEGGSMEGQAAKNVASTSSEALGPSSLTSLFNPNRSPSPVAKRKSMKSLKPRSKPRLPSRGYGTFRRRTLKNVTKDVKRVDSNLESYASHRNGDPYCLGDVFIGLLARTLQGLGVQSQSVLMSAVALARPNAVRTPLQLSLLKAMVVDINTTLGSLPQVESAICIQSHVRSFLVRRRVAVLLGGGEKTRRQQLMQRRNIFRGILNTEKEYVGKLMAIVGFYLQPLRLEIESKHIKVDPGEMAIVFSIIEQIVPVHTKFLRALEEEYDTNWPFVDHVGQLFVKLSRELTTYGTYVENIKTAEGALERMVANNKPFAKFLAASAERLQPTYRSGSDLGSLLREPLSRIHFYCAMLQQMLTTSTPGHLEYDDLLNAHAMMASTDAFLAKKMEDSQHRVRILSIQQRIVNCPIPLSLAQPGRALLGHWTFGVDELVVFNNLVLWGRREPTLSKSGGMKVRKRSHRSSMHLPQQGASWEFKGMWETTQLGVEDFSATTFKLVTPVGGIKFSSSEQSKAECFEAIATAIRTTKGNFGLDLATLCDRDGTTDTGIPNVVRVCVEFIREHCIDEEGLFRLSPSVSDMAIAMDIFDHLKPSEGVALNKIVPASSAPACATDLLKRFFRDLPNALVPFESFDTWIEAQERHESVSAQLSDSAAISIHKNRLLHLLYALDPIRLKLTLYLLELLLEASEEEDNLMDAKSLAIVLGPNILRPRVVTIQFSLYIPKITGLVAFLIEHSNELAAALETFEPSDTPMEEPCLKSFEPPDKEIPQPPGKSKKRLPRVPPRPDFPEQQPRLRRSTSSGIHRRNAKSSRERSSSVTSSKVDAPEASVVASPKSAHTPSSTSSSNSSRRRRGTRSGRRPGGSEGGAHHKAKSPKKHRQHREEGSEGGAAGKGRRRKKTTDSSKRSHTHRRQGSDERSGATSSSSSNARALSTSASALVDVEPKAEKSSRKRDA